MKTFIFAILFIFFGFGALACLAEADLLGCGLSGLIAYVCHRIAF